MELNGKKAIFLGDSITEGVGASAADKVYWNVLAQKTGLKATGYGVSGTRIARQYVDKPVEKWDYDFNLRALDMDKEADIVGVFGGTNDYGHGIAPIGTPEDQTVETFYGALNALFIYLINTYPKAFIFFMTPLHRINEARLTGDGYKPPMLPLKGYVEIIKEVANKYSVPVLDLYATSGIYPEIEMHKQLFMPDGLHPNDAGYEKLAGLVENFLRHSYHE